MSRLLITSVVLLLCSNKTQADSGTPATMFIGEVNLITSWKHEAVVKESALDSYVESFKELLRKHGYQTDECEENTAAWQRYTERHASPDKPEVYKQIDERLLAAQKCKIPPEATRAYDVKLILSYDAELKSRRAIIHLVALGNYPPIDGGYAHKPGELIGWYDVMNRAIDRALGRKNDPTAVHLSPPDEAAVGETVRLDARQSWDPDGDAFELQWDVKVKACSGKGETLPTDKRRCPDSLKRGLAPVSHQAGSHDMTREFQVPMVGDYEISVYAKIGAREEAIKTFQLRAYPRRTWTFFSRQGVLRLPKRFLSDIPKRELGLVQGFGLLRRFIHRISMLGWFEEIHYGLGMNAMHQISDFGNAMALLYNLDIQSRTLDRTGRYGVATGTTMSLLTTYAQRTRGERLEWGWAVATMIGWYYAFGENYMNRSTQYCVRVCPSVTIGPTFTVLHNLTAKQVGILLGAEAFLGIEF